MNALKLPWSVSNFIVAGKLILILAIAYVLVQGILSLVLFRYL